MALCRAPRRVKASNTLKGLLESTISMSSVGSFSASPSQSVKTFAEHFTATRLSIHRRA